MKPRKSKTNKQTKIFLKNNFNFPVIPNTLKNKKYVEPME